MHHRRPDLQIILTTFVAFLSFEQAKGASCGFDYFTCRSGKCIQRSWHCDGGNDCGDNSDERYCGSEECPTSMFTCLDKERCIQRSWFCDGLNDCKDKSDESFCDFYTGQYGEACPRATGPLQATWYVCQDRKRCYPSYFYCDKIHDCIDYSDERDCLEEPVVLDHLLKSRNAACLSILNRRKPDRTVNKWGDELARVAVALYLADPQYFASSNHTGQEISYEISLQLLSKLYMKKKLSTHQLSLYTNALIVSCLDPGDFFGVNILSELRSRVDRSNYTNPFTIHTLCNAGAKMTQEDVDRVLTAFDAHYLHPWTDTQALATMALACLSTKESLLVKKDELSRMTMELKRKQHKNGTVDNLASTALVLQALFSTNSYVEDFDYKEALRLMYKRFNSSFLHSLSIVDAYNMLPVLAFKSLSNISNSHCELSTKMERETNVLTRLQVEEDERAQVHYSMFIGDDMDYIRSWEIKVPVNYTFYNVLEDVAAIEPEYKIIYKVYEGKPYVSSLKNMVNDAEKEVYWQVCKRKVGDTGAPQIIKNSPVDVITNEEEEFILWYRTGSWVSKTTP